MATDSAAMSEYNNVVFHHVPNALAPGLLAALCVYAYCLGLVSWELILNGRHDVRLLRRPGWREPVKLANRFCYYACRYGALTFLLMTAVYMTTPGIDCGVYARVLNVLWILPLIFVDFLFISRTLALYGWDTALTAVLGTLYIIYVGLCCYSVILFGDGYQIPASDFCAYVTRSKSDQPHAGIFIAYWTVTIFLDTLILFLTLHRLVDGGLSSLPRKVFSSVRGSDAMSSKEHGGAPQQSLPSILVKQGIVYFVVLELSRLVYLVVYYSVGNETSWQILVVGLLVTLGPIMAGMLFRETGNAVKRTTEAGQQVRSSLSAGHLANGHASQTTSRNTLFFGPKTTGPGGSLGAPTEAHLMRSPSSSKGLFSSPSVFQGDVMGPMDYTDGRRSVSQRPLHVYIEENNTTTIEQVRRQQQGLNTSQALRFSEDHPSMFTYEGEGEGGGGGEGEEAASTPQRLSEDLERPRRDSRYRGRRGDPNNDADSDIFNEHQASAW